jgi:hypothetical protein
LFHQNWQTAGIWFYFPSTMPNLIPTPNNPPKKEMKNGKLFVKHDEAMYEMITEEHRKRLVVFAVKFGK